MEVTISVVQDGWGVALQFPDQLTPKQAHSVSQALETANRMIDERKK